MPIHIGVAIAQSEKTQTYYAVQLFGRPHSKRTEFHIANASPVAVECELTGRVFSLPPHATHTHQECRTTRLTVPCRASGSPRRCNPWTAIATTSDVSDRDTG